MKVSLKKAFDVLMSYGYNPFRYDYRYTRKRKHFFKDRVTGERMSITEIKKKRGGVKVARRKKDEVKEIEFRQGQVSLDYLMDKVKPDRCECGGRFTLVNAYEVCNKCGKCRI